MGGYLMSGKVIGPTNLYRHFDRGGLLLYVGISLSAIARLRDHSQASHWFSQIARVTIDTFPTREAALEAERLAIREEQPAHNVVGRSSFRTEALATASVAAAEIETVPIADATAILETVIRLKPLYSVDEAARVMGIPLKDVRILIAKKLLGYVEIPARDGLTPHGTPWRPKLMISGWQIIDCLEALGAKRLAA